jgi:type II secretion system protein N
LASESKSVELPRWVRFFLIPLAGLLLVVLFIYLGFPYAALGDRLASELQRRYGVRVDFETVGPKLHLAGPGIEASGVRATLADGRTIRIDRAALRPAWSTAWLRGDRAVYTELESDLGNVAGTLVLGESDGFFGDLEGIAVGRLPLPTFDPLGKLDGSLNASVDVLIGDAGPLGGATFDASDGAVDFAGFPMAIPFENLSGELRFGGETLIAVDRFELRGPMLDAAVTGNVLQARIFRQAPLRLEAEIVTKADLATAMRRAGLRIDRSGKAKLRVTGTVAQPNVR